MNKKIKVTDIDIDHLNIEDRERFDNLLLKKQTAEAHYKDFKKKYAALKTRIKNMVKRVAAIDKNEYGIEFLEVVVNNYVIDAEKKYKDIDKCIKRYELNDSWYHQSLKSCSQQTKAHPYFVQKYISEMSNKVSECNSEVNSAIDCIRIAKRYLNRTQFHFKSQRERQR